MNEVVDFVDEEFRVRDRYDTRFLDGDSYGEQRVKLSAIHSVQADREHVYIFLTSTVAHIIPLARVDGGDLQVFLLALKTRMANATAGDVGLERVQL